MFAYEMDLSCLHLFGNTVVEKSFLGTGKRRYPDSGPIRNKGGGGEVKNEKTPGKT